MRAGHSTRVMPASKAAAGSFRPLDAQRRNRRAGILELMAAIKFRRRQIEQPVAVLIDEPAAFLGRGPVLAGDVQRRAQPRRLPLDDGERLARLAGDDRRHVALENAGLLGGDLFERVAEKFAVIERQPRDDAGERALDDIGGVEPAAEPDFEQQHVGRMAREQTETPRRSRSRTR